MRSTIFFTATTLLLAACDSKRCQDYGARFERDCVEQSTQMIYIDGKPFERLKPQAQAERECREARAHAIQWCNDVPDEVFRCDRLNYSGTRADWKNDKHCDDVLREYEVRTNKGARPAPSQSARTPVDNTRAAELVASARAYATETCACADSQCATDAENRYRSRARDLARSTGDPENRAIAEAEQRAMGCRDKLLEGLASTAPSAPPEREDAPGHIVWKEAIVRDAPRGEKIIDRLERGAAVRVDGRKSGWLKIRYGPGLHTEGYVAADAVGK